MAAASTSAQAKALQTCQQTWQYPTAGERETLCLRVQLRASSMHRQHNPGCRTFKATLSYPNHGAHLLLQLLLQKDTACSATLCIQYGRMKSLKSLFRELKGSHTLPSNRSGSGGLVGRAISSYPVVVVGLQRKSVV